MSAEIDTKKQEIIKNIKWIQSIPEWCEKTNRENERLLSEIGCKRIQLPHELQQKFDDLEKRMADIKQHCKDAIDEELENLKKIGAAKC